MTAATHVSLDLRPQPADVFAAYLTVEARQARRRKIGWRCRACTAAGFDGPGLASFYAHWWAFHAPRSIWSGVR
jgi:hypothetical protein